MPPLGDGEVGAILPISTLSLDDAPGAAVKATPGLLYGWHLQNAAAAITYVQVFDAAAVGDVTIGTTTPRFTIGIGASLPIALSFSKPIKFATGIVVFATTTATGNTGATVNGSWFIA